MRTKYFKHPCGKAAIWVLLMLLMLVFSSSLIVSASTENVCGIEVTPYDAQSYCLNVTSEIDKDRSYRFSYNDTCLVAFYKEYAYCVSGT